MLVALVIGDPGRIDRRSRGCDAHAGAGDRHERSTTSPAVVDLVPTSSTSRRQDNGDGALATGAAIWLTNIIVFSLWYWLLDRGGPAERAAGDRSRRRSPSPRCRPRAGRRRAGGRGTPTTCTWPSPTPPRSARPTPAAGHSLGQDADDGAGGALAGDRGDDHRPGRQCPARLGPARRRWARGTRTTPRGIRAARAHVRAIHLLLSSQVRRRSDVRGRAARP